MRTSLIFLVSLVATVNCHPLVLHLEKDGALAPSLICPDLVSQCPDGDTCCKLLNLNKTGYGCCPMPQAECCKDGIHCCPHGSVCSIFDNTCGKGDSTVPMVKRLPSVAVARSGPTKDLFDIIVCPDRQTDCPDGNTCCKNADGSYGCCKHADAKCCDDKLHCCPSGYTCNLSSGLCEKPGSVRSLTKKRPIPVARNDDDGFEKEPAMKSLNNVVCPDQTSECSAGATCCILKSGQYGCCPIPKAVCCDDHVHCCPEYYICQSGKGTCTKGDSMIPLLKKQPAIRKQPAIEHPQNICPDDKSNCASDSTCCLLKSGQYGCCPEPKAVCCNDHVHCCPEGYTCETDKGMCTEGDSAISMLKKQSAFNTPQNVVCPDGTSECPTNNTCCLAASGQYACCPLPNAVCCEDQKHCCPDTYICEVSSGKCIKGDSIIPVVKKQPATLRRVPYIRIARDDTNLPTLSKSRVVECPDGDVYCPDGDTCCVNTTGGYGCCPVINAVCCADDKHCCPQNFVCDMTIEKCLRGEAVLPLFEKKSAELILEKKDESVGELLIELSPAVYDPQKYIHCGQTFFCQDGQTCCNSINQTYECCPMQNAVCCEDKQHCCPSEYTCSTTDNKCYPKVSVTRIQLALSSQAVGRSAQTIAEKKVPAMKSRNVVCPDQTSECPSGDTCCLLTSGEYGCCPIPKAVCCIDRKHCCPEGYTCQSGKETCTKGDSVIPVVKKLPAINKLQNIKCWDGSECPVMNTCCRLKFGQYGCCPYMNGACCSDGIHCCPMGYYCNAYGETCKKWAAVTAMVEKPLQRIIVTPQNVICPGEERQCPDNNTCCLTGSSYSCCPSPDAVCCPDKQHCCPKGYTCNAFKKSCDDERGVVVPFLRRQVAAKKVSAIKLPQNIVCPDQKSECSNNSTCCMLKSGLYGCCPVSEAVCCEDKVHCCPKDFTCQTDKGTCTKGDSMIPVLKKQPAIRKQVAVEHSQNVICPDKESECSDDSTCCMLKSGKYGCCPQPKAVCCDDHVHCCPKDYTCQTDKGMCTKGESVIPVLKKQPAIRKQLAAEHPRNIVCPDKTSECSNNSTCCMLKSGQYGCCPEPKAVCCDNDVQCCPQGFTCQTDKETCTKGESVIPVLKKQPAMVASFLRSQQLSPRHQDKIEHGFL